MAISIGSTPVLHGKQAAEFITLMYNNSRKPVTVVPTPKLKQASELIRANASRRNFANQK